MSAASSTVSTSAPTTRDSDEARAVRAARRRAFGEPGDGKPVDGNPTERWNAPANREHLGGSPLLLMSRRRRQLGAVARLDRGPPRWQPDRAVRISGPVVPEEGGEGSATVSADRRWTSPCRNHLSDRPDCARQPDADCGPRINHDRSPH